MANYTHVWNQEFINNTKSIANNSFNLALEIGCFEGLTSNYIIDNLLNKENGVLICIDPLTDNYLNENLKETDIKNNETIYSYFNNQYDRFINNTKHHIDNNKLQLYRDVSSKIFPELLEKYENQIDFVYIDGDHRAEAVYNDGINAFKLCRSGGYILFDDYSWGRTLYGDESTSVGIDKFLHEHYNQYNLIVKDYQVFIQKK